jgi:hypothetical protein
LIVIIEAEDLIDPDPLAHSESLGLIETKITALAPEAETLQDHLIETDNSIEIIVETEISEIGLHIKDLTEAQAELETIDKSHPTKMIRDVLTVEKLDIGLKNVHNSEITEVEITVNQT